MVLTVEAAKVASRGGDGKSLAPRQEMKERFFLNGIHMSRDESFVDQGVKGPPLVFAYATDSPLPVGDETVMIAQKTADLPPRLPFIEVRLFHPIHLGKGWYHIRL
jgi:hypothetical protein